ncbi:Opioid-binding protein/cell adhesion molecule [Stylophora pistillata]|uniref:Opioid-binding protein/cell adhesion molecule n=1 Tax=Stylophora pistillata TaxID=50429 RepID=A0A2B4RN69_STYPI|nr:Opioid-binding protein/cell adhesion molecule [Stylophora pistillata]
MYIKSRICANQAHQKKCHEVKIQGAHHEIKIRFLGEEGIDSGALRREFLAEVVPAIRNTLFSGDTPIDFTVHVQNGDFPARGLIVASSVAQEEPPPSFLDQKTFEMLVKNEVDILNLTAEKDLTQSERQLSDSIRNNIDRHRDTILERGYTGLVSMAHIEDIVRSLTKLGKAKPKALHFKLREPPEVVVSNDQDVCEGSSVTLSCNATGKPTPNITWTKEGENGTNSGPLPSVDGVYVISNSSRSSNGTYRCTASNGVGDPVNQTTKVIVGNPSSVDGVFISSNTAVEGYPYHLSCEVSGVPVSSVSWIKVTSGERHAGKLLNFTNISRNDTGNYTCEASNRCGNDSKTEAINVFSGLNYSDNSPQRSKNVLLQVAIQGQICKYPDNIKMSCDCRS